MDTGILILRLIVGLTVAAHGCAIVFGWFDGPGLSAAGESFAAMGYRPGKAFAFLASASEAGGGLFLALGLLTPLAGAAMVGTMLSAALSAHVKNGFWVTDRGFEYTLVLGAAGLALAFTGAGVFSFDHALGWTLAGNAWGIVAVVLGGVSALVIELYRRRTLATERRLTHMDPSSAKRAA